MALDRLIFRRETQIGIYFDEIYNKRQKAFHWVLGIIAASCYILVHVIPLKESIPIRLPFSLDAAIGCIPYVYIGYCLKRGGVSLLLSDYMFIPPVFCPLTINW